jgi:hypothetical protein
MRHPNLKVLLGLATFAAAVGVLGFGLSGCGSTTGTSPGASPQETSPPPTAQQTGARGGPATWPTEGSSPARLSGDGRYFGYVRSASADSLTIDFDVMQFFYGKSVQKAAEEDGVVRPGEPVSNDHYARNADKTISTLKLASDVRVTAGWPASFLMGFVTPEQYDKCEPAHQNYGACTQVPLNLPVFFKALRGLDRRYGVPAWLTIRDGLVVRIDEQYFP